MEQTDKLEKGIVVSIDGIVYIGTKGAKLHENSILHQGIDIERRTGEQYSAPNITAGILCKD